MMLLAIVGMGLSGFGFLQLAASMSGQAVGDVDRSTLSMMLFDMPLGTVWQVRMAALLIILGATLLLSGRRTRMLVVSTGAAAVALSTLPFFGHAAASEGPAAALHLPATMLHLLAAGAWLGALAGLLWSLVEAGRTRDRVQLERLYASLASFSTIGTIIVLVILATGIFSALMLVGPGNLQALPGSLYGRLLMVKIALFLAMLVLATLNRFRLTPALGDAMSSGDEKVALAKLRRSIMLETVAAISIIGLVAWLGILPPTGT